MEGIMVLVNVNSQLALAIVYWSSSSWGRFTTAKGAMVARNDALSIVCVVRYLRTLEKVISAEVCLII